MLSFVEEVCVPFLRDAQNPDGGWGYQRSSLSCVEPTCWALIALAKISKSRDLGRTIQRAADWLCAGQLPDGSWPTHIGRGEGSWATAPACLALHVEAGAPEAVARGTVWLCNAWPGEGGLWWRMRHWLLARRSTVRQNPFYRGWSWTLGTSSWVEPTSYALILLRNIPNQAHPRRATRRRKLGEGMLYDRMCPGGGWNTGNPLIYGVPGEPQVSPTVWALLALQDYRDRSENRKSLGWLELAYQHIRAPGSLSLAHICLEAYGRPTPRLEPALRRLHSRYQFLHSVLVMSWATLALSPGRDCLRCAPSSTDER